MTIIGITGPTGAGKTTALNELEKLGGAIIDCDAVYHEMLESDIALQIFIFKIFFNEFPGSAVIIAKISSMQHKVHFVFICTLQYLLQILYLYCVHSLFIMQISKNQKPYHFVSPNPSAFLPCPDY